MQIIRYIDKLGGEGGGDSKAGVQVRESNA